MQKLAVIVQYRLLHYRLAMFERLRQACADRGIKLELVTGQATRRESVRADEGSLPWARKVINRVWEVGSRDWLWQPLPADLRHADLVVVMQESRLLSNYLLLLRRVLGGRTRVAYWGHGRNFQSDRPDGLRERWKRRLITQVDWWFAYTELSAALVQAAGFPAKRITCLNNAIDTNGFKADLAACSEHELAQLRQALGLSDSAPVGLFCGSLYPDKRLDLLVAAADLVHAKRPDFVLLVIGNGPSMPQMQEAASSRPWLKLLGVRTGREKALQFRLAGVMLNPGLVGLHIVDAFCAGLVMVTTRAARHSPEVAYLEDGVNGVSTADTPSAYAEAVLGLLNAPHRLAAMQANARADAERYSLNAMVCNFADGIALALMTPVARR